MSEGLDLIWDYHEDGGQSTVLGGKNNKVYKLYPESILSLKELKEYKDLQNSFAGKKYTLDLSNDFFCEGDFFNKIEFEVLKLSDNFYKGSDIQTLDSLNIHEIQKIEGKTLFDMLDFNNSIIISIIIGDFLGIYENIHPINIKIIGKEKSTLKLLITDLSASIKDFIKNGIPKQMELYNKKVKVIIEGSTNNINTGEELKTNIIISLKDLKAKKLPDNISEDFKNGILENLQKIINTGYQKIEIDFWEGIGVNWQEAE